MRWRPPATGSKRRPGGQQALDEIVATFEVDGHDLIGKYEGGLRLWQEFTLRIPENQLLDLVQLDISLDEDPVAYFNRTGNVTTSRLGLKIGFSVESFALVPLL